MPIARLKKALAALDQLAHWSTAPYTVNWQRPAPYRRAERLWDRFSREEKAYARKVWLCARRLERSCQ